MSDAIDPMVPAPRLEDEHFAERHETFLRWIKERPIDLVLVGDSITRRWVEFPEENEHFWGKYNMVNFGVGSDAVQNLLWRVQNGEMDGFQAKVISLLIGTNNLPTNSGAQIAAAIREVVRIMRAKQPTAQIILNLLFPRGPQRPEDGTDDDPYYMDELKVVNDDTRQLSDERMIHVLDIGKSFIGADGEIIEEHMPDRLHPVATGFRIWGEALEPLVARLMS
jgi:platelet-activating factor acetylhydrolase IB subunit beta/gamma